MNLIFYMDLDSSLLPNRLVDEKNWNVVEITLVDLDGFFPAFAMGLTFFLVPISTTAPVTTLNSFN